MSKAGYDVRDHAELIAAIADRVELEEGSAHLALVIDASTTQEVVRVDRLAVPAEILEADEAREELRLVVERWRLTRRGRPRHLPVLVVARPGLCVFGPNEATWFLADRYANHLVPLWSMDLILVTEHGWVDFMSGAAGTTPALRTRATPGVRRR